MSRVTPEQFQEKHARRLKGSLQDMAAGVDRVTESPTAKAAKNIDKMRNNFLASIDSGKTKRRMESVTLEEWKRKMKDVGLPRVAQGIDAAKDKVISFAAELLPFEEALKTKVRAMPDASFEDSINRSIAWIRGMHAFQRKG